jgi:DNA-binding NtrC family response regulator/tetratricopeptide (TPR) repeat protein
MKPLAELVGDSPGMVAVREQVRRLLSRQADRGRLPPVLMQGETGTGKGLLARAIHRAGPRASGPFQDVNCAAIPDTLLEAELFGFERGAFTDARQAKAGLFQTANRGIIFLDEVGLLPEPLQAKLLKAIEDRAIRRLGSTRSEPVDVWILTASNEDLARAARERRFREDLYHRLAVVTLTLPPLRERAGDIGLLADHFLARACAEYGLRPKVLGADARAALSAYPWPGNVRELANVMERVALLTEAAAVTAEMLELPGLVGAAAPVGAPAEGATRLEDALETVERAHLLEALGRVAWNVTRAAAALGISRDTLRYRMEKYGLRRAGAAGGGRRVGPPTASPGSTGPGPTAPEASVPPAPAPSTVRWDRRRLAFLRAALILPPTTDPRLYPSRALEVLVEKVQSFGGRVEELSPSGLLGVFGLEPVEDAPSRAAHAAMAIQKAAERAGQGRVERVTVRCAICVRPTLVGVAGGAEQIDLEGKRDAAAVLESLIAATDPDGITVAETAAPFLDRQFALVPLGTAEAPGGRRYRLLPGERTGLGFGRRLAAFVGRGQELQLLRSRLTAAARGHGQVVGILGEAGMGKSRLLLEFRQSIQDENVAYLEGRCRSYGSTIPYLPVLDILRRTFRLAETDDAETITQKVTDGLTTLGVDAGEWAPPLLYLLGVREGMERLAALSPAAIKARTFEAMRQMGLRGSRLRPIVFVVEDLQWVDATSEECFSSLMDSLVGAPAMCIMTYRPGYRPPWVDRSYATQVALRPLSPDDSLSVVRSVLQRDDIPEHLAQLILAKTEGNPFFLEELSRAVGHADGGGELVPPAAVPDTIQEVVLARVERLSPEAKAVLQTASVLGREVALPLLRAVWDGPGDLDAAIRELMRLEFLYRQGAGVEPAYAFTHSLTQEVVYESLPMDRRRALHTAAGITLEASYADRPEEVYDRLAYHYSRTDQAEKALAYLTRLADKAARGNAHTEAVRILEEALGHVGRLSAPDQDRRRLELVLRQADALLPLGRFQDIVDLLLRHEAELDRVRDPRLAGPFHSLIARSYLFLGDDEQASRHAATGLTEAMRSADDGTAGKIHYVLAQRGALTGRPHDGLGHSRKAVELLTRAGESTWLGPAHWAAGLNHALRGEFGPALEAEGRAAALANTAGDPQAQCAAAWAIGIARALRGEIREGVMDCQRALELAPGPLDSAIALGWLGYAHLEEGNAAAATPRLEQAIQRLGRFRFAQLLALFTIFLAEADRELGRADRASDRARHGLDVATRAEAGLAIGWAHRTLGRIAAARGALDLARTHFAESRRVFEGIEAHYEVARTSLDLAGVAQAAGQADSARGYLAQAHEWFAAHDVPIYADRTHARAAELGLTLSPAGQGGGP